MELRIANVFLLSVEEPGDYLFLPSGVVVVFQGGRLQVYCIASNHNLYRTALHKFTWGQFLNGVVYRGFEFRLSDITKELEDRGWACSSDVPAILDALYRANPRHLFFLKNQMSLPT